MQLCKNENVIDNNLIKLFIDNDVNLSMIDKDGNTALIIVCSKNRRNIKNILSYLGENNYSSVNKFINIVNKEGNTALLTLINRNDIHRNINLFISLFEYNEVDFNIKNSDGYNFLMYMIKYYDNETIKTVLNYDIDIDFNATDNDGNTLLTMSYLKNDNIENTDIKIALILKGIDLSIKNKAGKIAIDYKNNNKFNNADILYNYIQEREPDNLTLIQKYIFRENLYNYLIDDENNMDEDEDENDMDDEDENNMDDEDEDDYNAPIDRTGNEIDDDEMDDDERDWRENREEERDNGIDENEYDDAYENNYIDEDEYHRNNIGRNLMSQFNDAEITTENRYNANQESLRLLEEDRILRMNRDQIIERHRNMAANTFLDNEEEYIHNENTVLDIVEQKYLDMDDFLREDSSNIVFIVDNKKIGMSNEYFFIISDEKLVYICSSRYNNGLDIPLESDIKYVNMEAFGIKLEEPNEDIGILINESKIIEMISNDWRIIKIIPIIPDKIVTYAMTVAYYNGTNAITNLRCQGGYVGQIFTMENLS
jgi:hypothetical protein